MDADVKPPVVSGVLYWRDAGAGMFTPADSRTRRWCKETKVGGRKPMLSKAAILEATAGKPFDHAFPVEFKAAGERRCNRCNAIIDGHPCPSCGCPEYRIEPGA